MQTRKLGYSELNLTTIGIGTWAMGGGDWKFGWGPQDDEDSIKAIHAGLDQGINWIDTAPIYGHGHSEIVVGKAIKEIRDSLFVATKCGRVWEGESREIGKSLRADSIRKEVEDSLRRLNIDVIDLYQIHWPQPNEEIEEGWGAIADLIKDGKIRYAGVSNFDLGQLKRAQAIHPITSLQPPYNMFRREIEENVMNYCKSNDIGIIAYSPMQAGLLTGKFTKERAGSLPESDWRSGHPFFVEPQLPINLEVVDRLREIAKRKNVSLPQLSLAWVLRKKEITAAIVGARRPAQIEETVKASSVRLNENEIAEIEGILKWRDHSLMGLDT